MGEKLNDGIKNFDAGKKHSISKYRRTRIATNKWNFAGYAVIRLADGKWTKEALNWRLCR